MNAITRVLASAAAFASAGVLIALPSGCYDITDPPAGSGLVSLTAADTGTADGLTVTPITVAVLTTMPASQWAVTLNTTGGGFLPGAKTNITVNPDSTGHVVALLQAPRTAGAVEVSGFAGSAPGGQALTKTITYQRALAQSIVVTPAAFFVQAGVKNSVSITAHLLRAVGKPSPYLNVQFTATDSNQVSRGLFTTALPSDSTGTIVVTWTPLDSAFQGTVTIRAQSVDDSTSGTAKIVVTP